MAALISSSRSSLACRHVRGTARTSACSGLVPARAAVGNSLRAQLLLCRQRDGVRGSSLLCRAGKVGVAVEKEAGGGLMLSRCAPRSHAAARAAVLANQNRRVGCSHPPQSLLAHTPLPPAHLPSHASAHVRLGLTHLWLTSQHLGIHTHTHLLAHSNTHRSRRSTASSWRWRCRTATSR